MSAYKSRPVIGGVCRIRCSGNQRAFLQATTDIEGLRNRFNFAISTGTSPDPSMRGEWEKYGSGSFSFAVLEELQKKEDQTDADFASDIDVLYEIWREKLKGEDGVNARQAPPASTRVSDDGSPEGLVPLAGGLGAGSPQRNPGVTPSPDPAPA